MFPRIVRFGLALFLVALPVSVSARTPQTAAQGTAAETAAERQAAAEAAREAAAQKAAAAKLAAQQAAAARQAAAQAAAAQRAAQLAAARQAAQQAAAARQAAAAQAAAQRQAAAQAAAAQRAAQLAAAKTATTKTAATKSAATSAGASSPANLASSLMAAGTSSSTSASSKSAASTKAASSKTATPASSSSAPSRPALPAGALGMAQGSNSILTVYGCSRQGTQVLCDTDLSNQDKSGTQLDSSMAWSDTYVVDDRGDRHQRTIGFFLNVDGEKRINLDVPYGQSIRYILVFNDVPAQVSKISLHGTTSNLDVESIPVTDAKASPAAANPSSRPPIPSS